MGRMRTGSTGPGGRDNGLDQDTSEASPPTLVHVPAFLNQTAGPPPLNNPEKQPGGLRVVGSNRITAVGSCAILIRHGAASSRGQSRRVMLYMLYHFSWTDRRVEPVRLSARQPRRPRVLPAAKWMLRRTNLFHLKVRSDNSRNGVSMLLR